MRPQSCPSHKHYSGYQFLLDHIQFIQFDIHHHTLTLFVMRNIFKKRSTPQSQTTLPAENSVLTNAGGLLVTPVLRPARFASTDSNIENLKQHFMESLARYGAVSNDDVVTTLPAPTMYSRWVETEFFLSPIEKLVIATDPRARRQRLHRFRRYYTNPIARLSKNNNRRAEALKEQMKELNWLIDETSSLSLPEYDFPCIPSVSSTSSQETEFGDGDTIRPLPRVAQMANDDVSVSDFAVYNRAMQRYLSESPQLSAQERSSMEELRSNRKKLMTSPRLSRITEDSEYRPASQRVSHARARRYMEEIDVRPEMRDPHKFSGSGFASAF
ncbi:hypothetical protein D6C90_02793 [Aureobasidium pullulans]|uniref:Uncharacterized protein n=1 Tax=Aureobasidium pullulans TaxID=5580 RepID=A0A4S9VE62_AURPU|nr:hypothetical protein D6C90_02793 [Aureobasidium pullulans]